MTMPKRRIQNLTSPSIAAISVALLCCIARVGHADNAEAQALFERGMRHAAESRFDHACVAFEASNRLESRAGTLIQIGRCREQLGQLASAWAAYREALTRAKDPRKREFALARAGELEPKLSYLTIAVPEASRVPRLTVTRDGQLIDDATWNRAMPVDGGKHVIVVRAPGYQPWQTTVGIGAANGAATIEVPPLVELAAATAATDRDGEPIAAPSRTRRNVSVVLLGGGAVLGVGGLLLGMAAKGDEAQARALCPEPQMPCRDAARATQLTRSGHKLALGANVGLGLGATAIVVAGALWFTRERATPSNTAFVPTLAGDRVGVAIVRSF
jgi:serine/threonine-protein kinase